MELGSIILMTSLLVCVVHSMTVPSGATLGSERTARASSSRRSDISPQLHLGKDVLLRRQAYNGIQGAMDFRLLSSLAESLKSVGSVARPYFSSLKKLGLKLKSFLTSNNPLSRSKSRWMRGSKLTKTEKQLELTPEQLKAIEINIKTREEVTKSIQAKIDFRKEVTRNEERARSAPPVKLVSNPTYVPPKPNALPRLTLKQRTREARRIVEQTMKQRQRQTWNGPGKGEQETRMAPSHREPKQSEVEAELAKLNQGVAAAAG